MPTASPFSVAIDPDWPGLLQCLLRQGTPQRVYHAELFLDPEVQQAVCDRYELLPPQAKAAPFYDQHRNLAGQRFLGYDYVRCGVDPLVFPFRRQAVQDTADMARSGGRSCGSGQRGPSLRHFDVDG